MTMPAVFSNPIRAGLCVLLALTATVAGCAQDEDGTSVAFARGGRRADSGPALSSDSGTADSGTADSGTRDTGPSDTGPATVVDSGTPVTADSGTCAVPPGQTRLASDGVTVCAPHNESIQVSSDCCDWNTGTCYPPSSADLACGGTTPPPTTSTDGGTAPTDSGPTAADSGGTTAPPPSSALPAFDTATENHVRDIAARGRAMGNSADVFAKIGDSITESASFLFDCGFGWYDLGTYTSLQPTIQYFSAHTLSGGSNSLNRQSLSATAGWTSADVLAGGSSSPLNTELSAIRPLWSIVMLGTNDIDKSSVTTFMTNLYAIVDGIESRGTVAVLSTIPNRHDTSTAASRVAGFNDAIRTVAANRHVPLVDYNVALAPLPYAGVSSDGIHPNSYSNGTNIEACVFTNDGLQFGYNMRNLTAIQMLERLRGY